MSRYSISPLIVQNRLLSQARSGARARNAAIGEVLNNNSRNSNNTKQTSSSVNSTNLPADTESKKNYTSMKSAADSLKAHIGNLFSVLDKEWDKMTEEETAKYRKEAEEEAAGFVDDYNILITTLTKENDYANSAYLNQIKNYVQGSESILKEAGITRKSDGTLSIDGELLKKADTATLQKIFGKESSFAVKMKERAENISANAQTNLALLNNSLYSGNYSYNKNGTDIFDILTGGSGIYNAKG